MNLKLLKYHQSHLLFQWKSYAQNKICQFCTVLSINYLSSSCYFRRNSNPLSRMGAALLQADGCLWQALALKFRVPLGHITPPNFVCSHLVCLQPEKIAMVMVE